VKMILKLIKMNNSFAMKMNQ